MTQEVDPMLEETLGALKGLKTDEQIDFVIGKVPSRKVRCVMCGSSKVSFIGDEEQIYVFSMPPELTDRTVDKRKYLVSLAECNNCGYVHLFAPQYAYESKQENSEGDV